MSDASARRQGGTLLQPPDQNRQEQQPEAIVSICAVCHSPGLPAENGVHLNRLGCPHLWCGVCLTFYFNMAVKDKPFSPPRCCVAIHPDILKAGAAPDVVKEKMDTYLARLEEHECRDRLYCHDNTCSAFIPESQRTQRVGTCPMCGTKTCKTCKAKSHFGPCSAEKLEELKGDNQLLELAESNKWKRCPECSAVVERDGGCPHMTCLLCRCSFCYKCGKVAGEDHYCTEGGRVEVLD